MPHFHYCGRYWRFGGDELSLPSLCSILARVVYTAFIVAVLGVTASSLQACGDGWVIELYLILSIALFCIAVLCDVMLMRVSLQGTMTQTEARKPLGHFLNMKIVLCALQSLCAIFGILCITRDSDIPCDNDFRDSKVTVGLVLCVVVLQFSEWLSYFCSFYCLQITSNLDEDRSSIDQSSDKRWESRCRSLVHTLNWLTCSIFGGHNVQEGFEQVARVLTTFFHHDGFLDIVASDIVAGIILVRTEQRAKRKAKGDPSLSYRDEDSDAIDLVDDIESSVSIVVSDQPRYKEKPLRAPLLNSLNNNHRGVTSLSSISLEEIEALQRCSVFALAAYSHLIFLYMKPCSGLCRLTCYRGASSCLCLKTPDFSVVGDGYYQMHTAGVENILK
jgi:hypothetical protein